MPAFGLVYANANDQAEVQIVSFGNLENVNTGSFSAGDTLYVSTTAGALTNSAPTGETAALQNIGRVVRSDASAGVIIVGGAGRSAATPNLDDGKIFLGNGSNQAVSTAISSIALSSFNDDLSYQPLDAGLTSISGLTTAADKMIYTTASDTYAVADLTSAGRALLDDADASAQRTTLGLGTAATSDSGDFLASTAGLDDLSDVAYTPGAGIDNYVLTYDHSTTSWGAEAAPTADPASETVAGVIEIATNAEATAATATDKALVPSNLSSIALSTLNDDLNYQPLDAGLTSISGLTTAADKMIYTTASDTYAVADLTSAGRALLDDADASAQRTTLGLGTAATSASTDFLASTAGLNDLSDVSFSAGAGIDGYVLTYDNATSSWGAEAAAGGSVALDGIAAGTGDATLSTAGNITFDATATDTDIIFKGTDGGVDTTFLTLDGSDAGTATFNHDIKMPTNGAQITMGPTNDVMITHVQNNGLLIELDVLGDGDFDPTVELKSAHTDQGGPRIRMNHSASDANNDIMGELSFEGKNATATQRIFGIMQGIKTKGANTLENGKILISPMNGGTLSTADGLSIEGSDGDALVTVLQHDGSSQGLVLGSTLLTSTASELNILDVSAAAPSANDVLSYDGVNLSWTALSYQPLDAGLTSISGLTTAADKMIYTTASDTYAVADLTSAGRALLDDADASAQRTTLGLGTAATSASTDFLASTAGLNDLSDVSFTAGAGIDNYVLTYDHSTTSWGAEPAAGGGGGTSYTYSAVSAATVTGAAWYHYSVDTSSNAVTINLPALSGLTDGDEIRVKLRDNTNTLTIDASGAETIDGNTTLVMNTQYEAVTLVAGSTEWEII
jgi:hypothetical protein